MGLTICNGNAIIVDTSKANEYLAEKFKPKSWKGNLKLKNENEIYATGIVVGYLMGLNKGTLEEQIENFHIDNEEDAENWCREIESKIRLVENLLPEPIEIYVAEYMFNDFARKIEMEKENENAHL